MKVLVTVLIAFASIRSIHADFVLSPISPSSVIPIQLVTPFFTTTNAGPSVRFQQVYAGADFLSYGDTRYQITELTLTAYSSAENEVILPNIRISFSTTLAAGDRLSNTFNENVGHDDATVFSGSIRVLYNGFDQNMHIVLDQPYVFSPRSGNLLMDVRNYQTIRPQPSAPGAPPWAARGNANADDGSSTVGALDVNLPTATFGSTAAIDTVFTVTPIPRLTLSLISTNLLFRWVNRPGGMLLEQSSSIAAGSTWSLAGGIITTNGNYKEVLLPLDPNSIAQFFRLVLPPAGRNAGNSDGDTTFIIPTPTH